ncbi:MAG: non-hydrolyzing UDP-N-acetylglucosamine 2-epimerase [Phycisphaerae bacterium]
MIKLICVCGARPNFMKAAPLIEAFGQDSTFDVRLVHTGQHYDTKMSGQFFAELGLPQPDINLEVGSGSHAQQTAAIMSRFEPICTEFQPDWVVVVGDVNSTIACALVASKLGIKVAHVEAGLRSFDRRMPEEINRILTDSISDVLFVTEPAAIENLKHEGVPPSKIRFVGNVMIDTLMRNRERANDTGIVSSLGLATRGYGVVTLHRPSNVDSAHQLVQILEALEIIGRELPLVFPVHPRTLATLKSLDQDLRGIRPIEPLGYLDFLGLVDQARVVLTDSGGIQEETTVLGVPCITMRENTERPVTVEHGTNQLAGTTRDGILNAYRSMACSCYSENQIPDLWDGRASERIAAVFKEIESGSLPQQHCSIPVPATTPVTTA